MVVVERDARLVEEGKEVLSMPPEPFYESFGIGIRPAFPQQSIQTFMKARASRLEVSFGTVLPQGQTNPITQDSLELLAEGHPSIAAVGLICNGQVAQEVGKTDLSGSRDDLVVSPPEVSDEDSLECFCEEPLQCWGATTLCNQVVGQGLVGEAPKPVGYSSYPPTCLVAMQQGTPFGFLAYPLIPSVEDLSQLLPHLGQSAICDGEVEVKVQNPHNLTESGPKSIVQPGSQSQKVIANSRPRKGICYDWLYDLFAAFAVVSVDSMLCYLGLNIFGNVLYDTFSRIT